LRQESQEEVLNPTYYKPLPLQLHLATENKSSPSIMF
jgi:hypothetical protein